MRRVLGIAVLIAIGHVVAHRDGVAAAPDAPTFTRDIAPILHARCVTCHRAGEVAPMALLTYEDARPWARSIKNKVVSRQMPPWMAERAAGRAPFRHFRDQHDGRPGRKQ
jgi:mono/diheme cytochrome c family protein